MTDEVRIEREGPVAVLVVDRPRALNAIARHTMAELDRALDRIERDPTIRAVVLTGGGDRFIAGGDLKDLGEARSADHGSAMSTRLQAVLARFEGLAIPVIAAIERFAYGGGAEVAMACDLRVIAHDAVIAFRHREFGVATAWGASRRLVRCVGRSRALSLLWTGRDVPAAEALAWGLADAVAPAGTPARAAAVALAREIATGAAGAVAMSKRLVMEGAELDLAAAGRFEAKLFGDVWAHRDHWDRVDAFWARQRARRAPATSPDSPPTVSPESRPEASPEAPSRGRFIVFEGLDGAGTTTQAKLLARHLRRQGRAVVSTHQPSPGPIGLRIRDALAHRLLGTDGERLDPRAIAALFVADRADHLRGLIEPALAAGHDVVCDRYLYHSLAYQGAECDPAWVAALNAPFPAPDLVLYLQVPAEVAAARRAARQGTPELYEVDDRLRRVAAAYDRLAETRPADPILTLDGARPVRPIQRECRAAVARVAPGPAPAVDVRRQ
ncbi:MAG: dTMP kinase [Myxococcales bacterium]|nr:dTMP kinase [Myxococcales bacterium]